MRLFLVSATQTLLLVSSIVTSRGQANPSVSLPQPRWPHTSSRFPSRSNFWIRWFTASATNTSLSTASPDGSLNKPTAGAEPAYLNWKAPACEKRWTLYPHRSAAYTVGAAPGETATRRSWKNWPLPVPADPNELRNVPAVVNVWIRSLFESAT